MRKEVYSVKNLFITRKELLTKVVGMSAYIVIRIEEFMVQHSTVQYVLLVLEPAVCYDTVKKNLTSGKSYSQLS